MDGSPHGEAAAALGIEWSRRFGADLLGLAILDEPSITRPEAVSLGATAFKRHRDEVRLAEARRRIHEVLSAFERRANAAGVRCALVEDVGRPHEQIVLEAQACDAVLLGRETHFQFETQEQPDETLSGVLRLSPRPVVVVPVESAPGEGVLVAYGEGREVARTLQTVVLLRLAGEEPVDLLAVHPDRQVAEQRLQRPGAFLAAHGVQSRLRTVASDAAVAEVILEEARRGQPRLLVMGAQGHHPLRDLFFTSVTRAVLKGASVPVVVGA
jgi:nucleotide-binding universal stress UspA family protein